MYLQLAFLIFVSGEKEPVEWQFRELRTPDPSKFLTVEGVV